MGQNEKQLTKAVKKIELVNNLITSYEKINELEEYNNMKHYTIILDYNNEKDFTKFFIDFQKEKYNGKENIFDIRFSLKNESHGLELFQKLREMFVKRNSIQYSGFSKEYGNTTDHFIKKNNNIELKTTIHNSKDLENLKKYNDIINDSKVFGYKGFNPTRKNKDELQLIKAKAKANNICNIINTLSELNNLEENYNDMKRYKLIISYDKHNDDYYKYNIKLTKNNLGKTKTILNINFSLNDHKDGLNIITGIIYNFNNNNEILSSTFNNGNSKISNKSKIDITTKIKTEEEKLRFGIIHEFLKPNHVIINNSNSKVKKLDK